MSAVRCHAEASAALLKDFFEIVAGDTSGQDSRAALPVHTKSAPISEPKSRPRCVSQRQQFLILPELRLPREHHTPRDPPALSGRGKPYNMLQCVSVPSQDLGRL